MNGLSDAAQRVADHAKSFVDLEVKLATAELKKKAAAVGTGIGLMVGAAGLATTLPLWASLLIVMGALIVLTAILAGIGYIMLQKGSNPVPEQAFEEAELTAEALRDGD
jgi:putative superfamily III holin-X